jgi:hypothetical protein
MPNRIKPKRSYTANSVPVVSGGTPDIERNEIAINWADSKLYTRNNSDQLVSITLGGGGGGSANIVEAATAAGFPATGASGTLYIATDVSRAYRWSGSVYVEIGTSGGGGGSSSIVPTDPYFANVSLLLHMEGTGSTFNDSSNAARTINAVGNATQSTSQFRWGGKSLYLDGSGDAVTVSMPAIALNDFAIEMWVYLVSLSGGDYIGLYDGRSGDVTEHPVIFIANEVLTYYVPLGGTATGATRITGGTVSTGSWHHVAVARSSGTTRMYFNGTQAGSSWSDSTSYPSSAVAYIGSLYNYSIVNGFIDDVRITIGSARGYTGSTITVPAAAFPDS